MLIFHPIDSREHPSPRRTVDFAIPAGNAYGTSEPAALQTGDCGKLFLAGSLLKRE
jgi:hypothetical protein